LVAGLGRDAAIDLASEDVERLSEDPIQGMTASPKSGRSIEHRRSTRDRGPHISPESGWFASWDKLYVDVSKNSIRCARIKIPRKMDPCAQHLGD